MGPVDQKLGTRSRDPADIMLAVDLEKEGFIGHAGFQAADVNDLGFRDLEDLGDQLHGFVI